MKALVLRLDAPLVSFGGVIVDRHGVVDPFPGTSLLTGLFANALGWHHHEFDRLQQLQDRIQFAARWDVRPQPLFDYQTVDLGAKKLEKVGWTTRGYPEHRTGGPGARTGTHERYRHYWNDGLLTLVVGLREGEGPSLSELHRALAFPARPLFLGRKACLPARPLLDPDRSVVEGYDLLSILKQVPVWDRSGAPIDSPERKLARWPAELESNVHYEVRRVFDRRDWANQLPSGSTWWAEGLIGGDT